MSRFDPHRYNQFRPLYPAQLFSELKAALEPLALSRKPVIVDLGCGTGYSTLSLLRAGIEAQVMGVDPDSKMLEQAAAHPELKNCVFKMGRGEATGLDPRSVDVVTVGSALHWMNLTDTRKELQRVLRPQGIIHLFEYQFPKATTLPELNEHVRRGFNLVWKALQQTPRGSFSQLVAGLSFDSGWKQTGPINIPMTMKLDVQEFCGLLFSQSRFLRYEETLPTEEREGYLDQVFSEVERYMGNEKFEFDFKLSSALLVPDDISLATR